MIILETLRYLAKFPLRESMLKAFSSGKSSVPGYSAFKDYVSTMPVHSVIPEIKGFVVGADIDDVKAKIENQDGVFMFFDYGELASSRDSKNTINDRWQCSITIANKMDGERDTLEFAINSDNMQAICRQILCLMLEDQQRCSWLKQLGTNYSLVPFDVKPLSAYGWSILFEREGADMLNVKNLPS